MAPINSPTHDPILAIYSRWIDLALKARREKAAQEAAATAVNDNPTLSTDAQVSQVGEQAINGQ